jgi:16S rRNA (guanine966-N2)-methyltransferase
VLVDSAPRVVAHLTGLIAQLGVSDEVRCARAEGLEFLARTPDRFDVVFLDPPFGAGLLVPACSRLADRGLVAPGGAVYLESEIDAADLALPPGWALHRSGRAGDVRYYLARPGAP